MSTEASWADVHSIVALGEPLIELQPDGHGQLRVALGGDVANVLSCLARLCRQRAPRLQLATALGGSLYSEWVRERLGRAGIELIEPASAGEPGLYGISPEPARQGASSYWREHSAAHGWFSCLTQQELEQRIPASDLILVSGISLALCSRTSLTHLRQWLTQRARSCRVIFDGNYRPALWQHALDAGPALQWAEQLASVRATSLEDERLLHGMTQTEQTLARLSTYQGETLVRGGAAGCWVGSAGHWEQVPAIDAPVVDTVGAGDAHLAGYLAARMAGQDLVTAACYANQVAAAIVGQRGAMVTDQTPLPALISC